MGQRMRPTDPNLRSNKAATPAPGMLRAAQTENGMGACIVGCLLGVKWGQSPYHSWTQLGGTPTQGWEEAYPCPGPSPHFSLED